MQKWVNLCNEPEIRRAHLTLHTPLPSPFLRSSNVPFVLAFVGWITRSTNYFPKITRKLLSCVCVIIIAVACVYAWIIACSPCNHLEKCVKVTSTFFVARQIKNVFFHLPDFKVGILKIIMRKGNRGICDLLYKYKERWIIN